MKNNNKIKYLSPIDIDIKRKKKYCFFKKRNIKYIDYKNPDFLLQFINEFGKILPRRITGTSKKYQILLKKAIKRCRHIGLLPFISDELR
ncbi:MAG: 30S ribosomal protein S18 [Candidatus Shikimatogenerans bostrichidophilus]|nr:MAG: 30S ribosomal protein S18 [Candidatus Shikimatogenerans bostrichidophilus]